MAMLHQICLLPLPLLLMLLPMSLCQNITGCGGRFSNASGVISSPGYPSAYPRGLNCTYTIVAQPGHYLTINITNFNLRFSNSCIDYLQIRRSSGETLRWCGQEPFITLNTTGTDGRSEAIFNLTFISAGTVPVADNSTASNSTNIDTNPTIVNSSNTDVAIGFRIVYDGSQLICGGQLSGMTGNITSPFYPVPYPHHTQCLWEVNVTPGLSVALLVGEMWTERCCDHLYVFEDMSAAPLARFSGRLRDPPAPVLSQNNSMTISFKSDSSMVYQGFEARYLAVNRTACGGNLSDAGGTIRSPEHRGVPYYCVWTINPAEKNLSVMLTSSGFTIPNGTNCRYEGVTIYSREYGTIRYCDVAPSDEVLISNYPVNITYVTDGDDDFISFNASYRSVFTDCGGTYTNMTGVVTSPNFSQSLSYSADCQYQLVAPPGHIITINITDFSLEQNDDCLEEYLEIRNGITGTRSGYLIAGVPPVIGRYCGSQISRVIVSDGSALTVRLVTRSTSHGFSLSYQQSLVCGQKLTGPSGNFSSPGYPLTYPRNAHCVWSITVDPAHVVRLHILNLTTEVCCDKLILYDNASNNGGPLLATFQGLVPSPPPMVMSYTNSMRVIFVSDNQTSDGGFLAQYDTVPVQTGCGAVLTAQSGAFASPGYPVGYQHNANCTWVIRVERGYKIRLNFAAFDLEKGCSYDYVAVYSGASPNNSSREVFCGSETPPSLLSSNNTMRVEFRSDASVSFQGFSAQFVAVPIHDTNGCGGVLNQSIGSFASPNYPDDYPSSANCTWLITVAEGFRINLTFQAFLLETGCSFDSVSIYSQTSLIATHCGRTNPGSILSPSNYLRVVFKSDASITYDGFYAVYRAVNTTLVPPDRDTCGGYLNGTNGTFTSPGFPNDYRGGLNCRWFITVPPNWRINLTFHAFELESTCSYDSFSIYEGDELLDRYCGRSLPAPIVSSNNTLMVQFQTDNSIHYDGFNVSFRAINTTEVVELGCFSRLNGTSGNLTTRNYPEDYNSLENCTWYITVPEGLSAQLIFHTFQMETHRTCNYDYVLVYAYHNRTSLIGRFCSVNPGTIVAPSNTLMINFVSDRSINYGGFSASYSATNSSETPPTVGCGQNFTALSGNFTSPNFPADYNNHADCVWFITADDDYVIHLDFYSFALEAGIGCMYDYLAVYGGTNYTLLGRFCGDYGGSISSSSNTMKLNLITDYSDTEKGFHARYYTTLRSSQECGENLTTLAGVISSPNHPELYHNNADCTWNINVPPEYTVQLTFSLFDIEAHSDCNYDSVAVYDGTDLVGTYCGSVIPPLIQSTNNSLQIIFTSDSSSTGGGFIAEYTALYNGVCGGTFSNETGMITSPGFPDPYPNGLDCLYYITAPPTYTVKIMFNRFKLEIPGRDNNCSTDYLLIRDGWSTTSPVLARYCGRRTDAMIQSSGQQLSIQFVTNLEVVDQGFNLTYRTRNPACGGNYTALQGTITSENYDGRSPYLNRTNCRWLLTTRENFIIRLTFSEFDIEYHDACEYDRVMIYDGADEASPVLARGCGRSLLSETVISHSNVMLIHMITDDSKTGKGFKAVFDSAVPTTTRPPFITTTYRRTTRPPTTTTIPPTTTTTKPSTKPTEPTKPTTTTKTTTTTTTTPVTRPRKTKTSATSPTTATTGVTGMENSTVAASTGGKSSNGGQLSLPAGVTIAVIVAVLITLAIAVPILLKCKNRLPRGKYRKQSDPSVMYLSPPSFHEEHDDMSGYTEFSSTNGAQGYISAPDDRIKKQPPVDEEVVVEPSGGISNPMYVTLENGL